MSTVKELTLSPDGTVAEAGAAVADEDAGADELDVDDEQPAAIRAATPATATHPHRERGLFVLPSSIPYTFRHNVRGYADEGHRGNVCPYAMKGRCCGDCTSTVKAVKNC